MLTRDIRVRPKKGGAERSFMWYPGASAEDIKSRIARAYGLPLDADWFLLNHVEEETLVCRGMPSGAYSLVTP